MPKPDKLPAFDWGFKGDSIVIRDQRGGGGEIIFPYPPKGKDELRAVTRNAVAAVCKTLSRIADSGGLQDA